MHYLYKVTNNINNKNYIGQTNNLNRRWQAHKNAALQNKPEQIIHHALIKYGVDNFEFEHIATCKTWEDANELETLLVDQYESHISTGKGYNSTRGGFNAPKTEEWKQMMRDWHASLSSEEKAARAEVHRQNFLKYFKENGHPSLGQIRTEEQRARMSEAQIASNKSQYYTDEIRQKMSESHIGIKDSEETKAKKSDSAKEAWETRIDYSRKCEAPGCEISGKAKYKIINGIRYCNMHGLRMLQNGTLDKLPPFKYTLDNPMPEEVRKKCGVANIGRTAHNRIIFAPEQIDFILSSGLSMKKLSKHFKVTEKVIKRIKDGKY